MTPGTDVLIHLDRVSCKYGRRPVLVDASMSVGPGDFFGVVGPSGSGKTTLIRAMAGVVTPFAGTVYRRPGLTVGFVPQVETVNWHFPVTVREVVLMAGSTSRLPWASQKDRAAADEVLDRLGLEGLARRHILELSGGQQQRVFLARALVRRPQVVLLDEPTSGVDVRTRHDVLHLLRELNAEGLAIVLTTHDLNGVATHLPQLVCLNTEVIATGTPEDVLRADVLELTYGAPMDVLEHGGMRMVVETLPEADPNVIPLLQARGR